MELLFPDSGSLGILEFCARHVGTLLHEGFSLEGGGEYTDGWIGTRGKNGVVSFVRSLRTDDEKKSNDVGDVGEDGAEECECERGEVAQLVSLPARCCKRERKRWTG